MAEVHPSKLRVVESRFRVPEADEYDYSKSSAENHSAPEPGGDGPFQRIRDGLDHGYHGHYNPERQRIQDDIIQDVVMGASVKADSQEDGPWAVFTAGAMGAGKGWTINWMSHQGYFPLPDLVQIDPDLFKAAFPEWRGYVERDRLSAGSLTHKESGYMVEIAHHAAMNSSKNVWVDGSLRNHAWYSRMFDEIRERWPEYRIAILHVYTNKETVLERARQRALITGREVPEQELLDSIHTVPESVEILSGKADFTAHISNHPGQAPKLERVCEFDRCVKNRSGSWEEVTRRFQTASVEPKAQICLQHFIRRALSVKAVAVFSKTYCTFSVKVKMVLQELGIVPHVVELDQMREKHFGLGLQAELQTLTGIHTVPQVFVRGAFLGNCDTVLEMYENDREGLLAKLTQSAGAIPEGASL